MIDYGLQDKVALITGANNPQDIAETILFPAGRQAGKLTASHQSLGRTRAVNDNSWL